MELIDKPATSNEVVCVLVYAALRRAMKQFNMRSLALLAKKWGA